MAKKRKSTIPNFTLDVNLLQKYANKDTVRNLNADFQRSGGKVAFKSTTTGYKARLSHPDSDYLGEFQENLMKELTEPSPEELAKGPSEPEGKPEHKEPAPKEPKKEPKVEAPPKVSPLEPVVKEVFDAALELEAIDDGQILRYAYQNEVPEDVIKKIRKTLGGSRCKKRGKCPYQKSLIKFEDAMKNCSGIMDKCEFLSSNLKVFYPKWRENVSQMFDRFIDKKIQVRGKISNYFHVSKPSSEPGAEAIDEYNLLLFDTIITYWKKDSETRKLWVKVPTQLLEKFNSKTPFHQEDIISVKGTLIWNESYFNHVLQDILEMKVEEEHGDKSIMESQ